MHTLPSSDAKLCLASHYILPGMALLALVPLGLLISLYDPIKLMLTQQALQSPCLADCLQEKGYGQEKIQYPPADNRAL